MELFFSFNDVTWPAFEKIVSRVRVKCEDKSGISSREISMC